MGYTSNFYFLLLLFLLFFNFLFKNFCCVSSIELQIPNVRINYFAQVSRTRVWVAADKYIIVLSTDLKEIKQFKAHDKKINQICVIHTSSGVWTCSDDGTIAIWDDNGVLQHRRFLHKKSVNCLLRLGEFVVSGSSDACIIVWDVNVSFI